MPIDATLSFSPGRIRLISIIIASALFMEQLDITIIATALPTMATALHASPLHMSVAMTAYLLSLAIFIPASAVVADRFGSRNVFRGAMLVFTLGSILCGASHSLTFLVCARLLQGVGGAVMMPVGRLILVRNVAKEELVSAMAWVLVPGLIGSVVGPLIGGLIVTYASWRWIFYINVPIGIAGIVLATFFIPDIREERPGRFDLKGFLISGVALACLVFGLQSLSRGTASTMLTVGLIAIGLAASMLYLRYARSHPAPILDIRLMRLKTYKVSVLGGSLTRVAAGSLPFLLPLMMQLGFDMSPIASGAVVFVSAAGAMLMKATAKPILRWLGYRNTLVWNSLIASLLVATCAFFRPGWPLPVIYVVLLATGFLQSLQFTAYNTLAYADVPNERTSAATSFYVTFQQLMLSVGITVAAGALHVSTLILGHDHLTLTDFSVAFLTVAAFSVMAMPICATIDADAGADMSGHARRVPRPKPAE